MSVLENGADIFVEKDEEIGYNKDRSIVLESKGLPC